LATRHGVPADDATAESRLADRLRRPALFLDRDGVINRDTGYVHRIEDFVWIDGARQLIKAACDAGYHVFVVTNQGGVAHGYYDEAAVRTLHRWISAELEKAGAFITDFRYCPHHPEGVVAEFARPCSCRKPNPGMLLDLIRVYDVRVAESLLIGDRESDLEAAASAGVRGVLFAGGNLYEQAGPLLEDFWRNSGAPAC
jgi:D-glycero-D-manno-heptose 1,7-bisphosphate phosphatase